MFWFFFEVLFGLGFPSCSYCCCCSFVLLLISVIVVVLVFVLVAHLTLAFHVCLFGFAFLFLCLVFVLKFQKTAIRFPAISEVLASSLPKPIFFSKCFLSAFLPGFKRNS